MNSDIGYWDHGVGYLDPDKHDPAILFDDDYENYVDEFYDEYHIEAKYLDEDEDD